MKKLIAISVVFALVAGTAFAVDLGGAVTGTVTVLQSDTSDATDGVITTGDGVMNNIRIHGGGEANENFGGYFRFDNGGYFGNAWWKPIDQFKLLIGSNGYDGFIGKEGNTGWMFMQTPTDTGVTFQGANVWGSSIYDFGITTRAAFFEGGGDGAPNKVYLFITPMEMLSINVLLPLLDGLEVADAFKTAVFQLDLNLDFGNIALTYQGGLNTASTPEFPDPPEDDDLAAWADWANECLEIAANFTPSYNASKIYLYYGGSFGDLSLDVGIGYTLPVEGYSSPINVGLGVKYALDTFGVKFRTVVGIPMEDTDSMKVLADVLPYFNVSDNITAFVSVGLGMLMPNGGDTVIGWHFNPYLQVGEEWGAKFLAGIKVSSAGGDDAVINWAVPIALIVSF